MAARRRSLKTFSRRGSEERPFQIPSGDGIAPEDAILEEDASETQGQVTKESATPMEEKAEDMPAEDEAQPRAEPSSAAVDTSQQLADEQEAGSTEASPSDQAEDSVAESHDDAAEAIPTQNGQEQIELSPPHEQQEKSTPPAAAAAGDVDAKMSTASKDLGQSTAVVGSSHSPDRSPGSPSAEDDASHEAEEHDAQHNAPTTALNPEQDPISTSSEPTGDGEQDETGAGTAPLSLGADNTDETQQSADGTPSEKQADSIDADVDASNVKEEQADVNVEPPTSDSPLLGERTQQQADTHQEDIGIDQATTESAAAIEESSTQPEHGHRASAQDGAEQQQPPSQAKPSALADEQELQSPPSRKREEDDSQSQQDDLAIKTPPDANDDSNSQRDGDLTPTSETVSDGSQASDLDPATFCQEDVQSKGMCKGEGMTPTSLSMLFSIGSDASRYNNVAAVLGDKLAFISGNLVVIKGENDAEPVYIRSSSGQGIGAIAASPCGQLLAIGENTTDNETQPMIRIYHLPTMKVARTLRGGARAGYASLDFNAGGDKLASVATAPDFMLTVWDWREETLIQRSRAFSSDVWRVVFSPYTDGLLATCGPGHIRFWKMATTFTGLKLQGQIGKFGRTELSDISGLVFLPDGKVVTGSEWGNLLLWEGGHIKCEITPEKGESCHAGAIDFLGLMPDGDIVSAGADGKVCLWAVDTIDTADRAHDSPFFHAQPLYRLRLKQPGVHIRSMALSMETTDDARGVFFAQDCGTGCYWRIDMTQAPGAREPCTLFTAPGASLSDAAICEQRPLAAIVSADGKVSLVNLTSGSLVGAWQSEVSSQGMSVAWPSTANGRIVLCGFDDGVVRIIDTAQPEDPVLIGHVRPHKAGVRHITTSLDGQKCVTVGLDGSVFFFQLDVTAEGGLDMVPLGFNSLPEGVSVNDLDWSANSLHFLLSCSDGAVREYCCPAVGEHNTEHSFALPDLCTRTLQPLSFTKQVPKARKPDEDEEDAADTSQQAEADDDEPDSKKNQKDAFDVVALPTPPAQSAWYAEPSDRESLVVAYGSHASGILYRRSWVLDQAVAQQALPPCCHGLLRHCKFWSASSPTQLGVSALLCTGGQLILSSSAMPMDTYSMIGMHNSTAPGASVACAVSARWSSIVSAGSDGSAFVIRTTHDALQPPPTEMPPLAISDAKALQAEKDQQGGSEYSLEEAKEKAEQDRLMMTAEEKKAEKRRFVQELRQRFAAAKAANSKLSEAERLPSSVFDLDPELKHEMLRKRQLVLQQVEREMAWLLENHRVAHSKVRQRYVDVVKDHLFCVRPVCSDTCSAVWSYRTVKPSDTFLGLASSYFQNIDEDIVELEDRKLLPRSSVAVLQSEDADLAGPSESAASSSGERVSQDQPRSGSLDNKAHIAAEHDEQDGSRSTAASLSSTAKKAGGSGRSMSATMRERAQAEQKKIDERRTIRRRLADKVTEHKSSRPDPSKFAPEDQAEIEAARLNIGDYKLKTGDEYVVPVERRVNTSSKRRQLVVLRQRLADICSLFNSHLKTLRDHKLQLAQRVSDTLAVVDSVARSVLSQPPSRPAHTLIDPTHDNEEWPEHCSMASRAALDVYKSKLPEIEAAERRLIDDTSGAGSGGADSGGFGGFGGADGNKQPTPSNDKTGPDASDNLSATVAFRDALTYFRRTRDTVEAELSSTAEGQRESMPAWRISALTCLAAVTREAESQLVEFDQQVTTLAHLKRHIDVKQKLAEYLHIFYFQELIQLKVFDVREHELESAIESKRADLRSCRDARAQASKTLDEKKAEIVSLAEAEKQVQQQFAEVLSSVPPQLAKFVTRLFRRKLKRAARTDDGDGDSSDSDDESSDEEESDEDDDFDSDTEYMDLDTCPAALPEAVYERVLELNRNRAAVEERQLDTKRAHDFAKKGVDQNTKREQQLAAAVDQAEKDIAEFQKEKQAKLNELFVIVPLRPSQIHVKDPALLQGAGNGCHTVFSKSQLDQLYGTVDDLAHQKTQQKKAFREIRQQQAHYQKLAKERASHVAELQSRLDELHRLKFGGKVDLEEMESKTVNQGVVRLEEEINEIRGRTRKELKAWDKEIERLRVELTQMIQENSLRLRAAADLTVDKRSLEQQLDKAADKAPVDPAIARHAHQSEVQRIREIAAAQRQEIDALRDEIMRLRHKGARVMPPGAPQAVEQHQHPGRSASGGTSLPPL